MQDLLVAVDQTQVFHDDLREVQPATSCLSPENDRSAAARLAGGSTLEVAIAREPDGYRMLTLMRWRRSLVLS
jgi:hypothetical protein